MDKKIEKLINSYAKTPPKLRIIPINPEDKNKAKVLTKILKEEWPAIEANTNRMMKKMIWQCFIVGKHKWSGYGEPDMHYCLACGLRAPLSHNPRFIGKIEVNWE